MDETGSGGSRDHAEHEHHDEDHGGHDMHADHEHQDGDHVRGNRHAGHNGHDEDHGGHDKHAGHSGRQEDHGGHDKHAGHSVGMFRSLFLGSLLLTIPTLIWSDLLQGWFGYTAPSFPGSGWIPAVFGTAVFAYGGRPFLRGALGELKSRMPGMMTLITLAIVVAFAFSVAVTFGFRGMALWWELATLVTIMLLGHWIEMRSINRARGALKALAKLLPDTAIRLDGERQEEVPVSELVEGDLILIRPGANVPADGTVKSGRSSVNEALITGESKPVTKEEGDTVIAGTVNGDGSLRVEITATGEETSLAGIMRLVSEAQESRSRAQALADRAAFVLTLVAVGAGVVTLTAWLIAGAETAFAIERMVTVLVIACPHALGLAIPLVVAISTTLGAQAGLLVRDRRGLEEARLVDAVVFDKTGTLTRGEFRVVDIATDGSMSDDEALALAAAVERDSEHTIGRGIVGTAEERELEIPSSSGFESIPGHGVKADADGRTLHLGGPALLSKLGVEPAGELRELADAAARRGQSAIHMIEGDTVVATFAVADAVRPESADAIRALREAGIEVVMMTGDSKAVADAVAEELGIDTVFAEVLPDQKASKIEALKKEGKRVAMVGDGVNDAPALVSADVGIAIGAGTDVAVEAGDVVLVRSDPRDVPRILRLSRLTYRKMVQNLWWAAGYNIVAIPLAAGVLAGQGILLHPAVGAILMSMSTVIVAVNAQLLRRAEL